MLASRGQPWVRAALLVGVGYFLVGRVFALPTAHAQAWRLAAWFVSAATFAGHIWYEHFTLRSSPRVAAFHAAVAVAVGAFGLAIAGMIHTASTGGAIGLAWILSLVLWPAFTALPAFIVALVMGVLLARFSGNLRNRDTRL